MVETVTGPAAEFRSMPLAMLVESKTNPRQHYNPIHLAELAENVKLHGVLAALLVRKVGAIGKYEIIAGSRRFRAAKAAALESVPVRVVELDDDEALEIQVIENLQREDVHPLDEAMGYQALLKRPGYDVEKIAAKVGKSLAYVYTRVKLAELTEDAQKRFLLGEIPLSHALELARLKPAEQARAMKDDGALFEPQRLRYDDDDRKAEPRKTTSLREFKDWIARHIRYEAKAPDPVLFPETAATLKEAAEEEEKVVHITHDYQVLPEAKDKTQRTYGPMSWKRADGTKGAKACEHAVTGVIVVGKGRGEAFRVCINKEKCRAHWPAKKKAKAKAAGAPSAYDKIMARQAQQREREERQRARWEKVLPEVLAAVAARVQKLPATANGRLADFLTHDGDAKEAGPYIPRGKSAEDLVRYLAFLELAAAARQWRGHIDFPKVAGGLGVNVKAILAKVDVAEPAKPEEEQPAKASTKKGKARK